MSKKKPKSSDVRYIAVEDLIAHLGLLGVDVYRWLLKDKVKFRRDNGGRESVPMELLDRYSIHNEYKAACARAVALEKALRNADYLQINQRFKKRRIELINIYEMYIKDLETLHRKYLDSANNAGYESNAMAAYLLLSRVISMLKMGCLSLRNGYWYCGSLLREVDECLDVAQYLIITKGTPEGKRALSRWFRQNRAPKHEDCRKEIAIHRASLIDGTNQEEHQDLMNELYQKKSKFVHPTHRIIREVTKYNADNDISVEEVDYGPSNYERKLFELTDLFRSGIWSSFQCFTLCFHQELPLSQEDIAYLLKYDKEFQKWDNLS